MATQDRIGALRAALAGLVGKYRRFRGREEVTLLPFSSAPAAPSTYTVAENDPAPTLQRIAAAGNALVPQGDTAIYQSLEAAYQLAEQQIAADPDRFTSIVLMTDGENTTGPDIAAFRAFLGGRPAQAPVVPVFPVLFGESNNTDLAEVAQLTGGRTFDARNTSLASAFTEIRGYV